MKGNGFFASTGKIVTFNFGTRGKIAQMTISDFASSHKKALTLAQTSTQRDGKCYGILAIEAK